MTYLLQNLHFIFIHFPIALLLFSFVFDLLARLTKKQEWHTAGFLSLLIGTLGAVASVITGPEEARNPLFPTHELFGKLTMIWFILLSLVRCYYRLRKSQDIGGKPAYLIAALIGICLLTYTGHLGGQMVHRPRPAGGVPGQGPARSPGSVTPGGAPQGGTGTNAPVTRNPS